MEPGDAHKCLSVAVTVGGSDGSVASSVAVTGLCNILSYIRGNM